LKYINSCLIAHTAKIIATIHRRRIERKIEDVLGEDKFAFRRGRVTRDAVAFAKESDADRTYRRYCPVRAWTRLRFLEGARDRRWL